MMDLSPVGDHEYDLLHTPHAYAVPWNDEASISYFAGSIDVIAEQEWLEAVRNAVTNVRRVHINVQNTFVEVPESVSMPSTSSRRTV